MRNKTKEETYNNGKDLMPEDIQVTQFVSEDGKTMYRAHLGFTSFNVETNAPHTITGKFPKMYLAVGSSPKEAKRDLVEIVKKHLDRAIQ